MIIVVNLLRSQVPSVAILCDASCVSMSRGVMSPAVREGTPVCGGALQQYEIGPVSSCRIRPAVVGARGPGGIEKSLTQMATR